MVSVFFFNDTATTEIYTLSLHDALPIYPASAPRPVGGRRLRPADRLRQRRQPPAGARHGARQGDRHPVRPRSGPPPSAAIGALRELAPGPRGRRARAAPGRVADRSPPGHGAVERAPDRRAAPRRNGP